jgi:hypothetical protein
MRFIQVTSCTKKTIIDWPDKHLFNGIEVATGGFLGFEGLDDAGFSHKIIITGGDQESVKIAALTCDR